KNPSKQVVQGRDSSIIKKSRENPHHHRGSNDCVIVDALETTTLVMDHVNQDLQGDHNEGVDELCGLGNFQKNNLPMFKGRYDPEGVQTWIQELRKNYRVITCTDA
ncbi:hypothetical protein KIW84_040555, partial [Lathyrus oleraceus]